MSKLTAKEIKKVIEEWYKTSPLLEKLVEMSCEAKLAHTLTRFKKALEQSRKGKDIDLSEEEFELFSAIQNDGIAKNRPVCAECKGSKVIWVNYKAGLSKQCPTCQGTGIDTELRMKVDRILMDYKESVLFLVQATDQIQALFEGWKSPEEVKELLQDEHNQHIDNEKKIRKQGYDEAVKDTLRVAEAQHERNNKLREEITKISKKLDDREPGLINAKREEIAILLHSWLHSSGSPSWESKKTPEVVRVGYRKRADQIIALMKGETE